jgi:hypothetical protein
VPLNIQVERGKKLVQLYWDDLTLNCVLTAALKEGDPDLEYQEGRTFGNIEGGKFVNLVYTGIYYIDTKCPLWKQGEMTLGSEHRWEFGDPQDDGDSDKYRLIELKPGDKIKMWRS